MGIIRKTKSIEIILGEFQNNTEAISVVELVNRVQTKINKSTIYRVLDRLEDDGIVHSFLGKNGIKWYAKCTGCSKSEHIDIHPHFQCTECQKVDCLPIYIQIPKLENRHIVSSQVLIEGICEQCIEKSR